MIEYNSTTLYDTDTILRMQFCKWYDDEEITLEEWNNVSKELSVEMSKFWDKTERILKNHNMKSAMGVIGKIK